MRIADIAKKYHITDQAVRARIKRSGLVLADLRRPGSNVFTEEGERLVMAIFENPQPRGTNSQDNASAAPAPATSPAGSGRQLATIRAELDEMKLRTAKAEALAEERERMIQLLREQIREKDATIVQMAAAAALPAVTPPQEEPKRRGLFGWLKRGGK